MSHNGLRQSLINTRVNHGWTRPKQIAGRRFQGGEVAGSSFLFNNAHDFIPLYLYIGLKLSEYYGTEQTASTNSQRSVTSSTNAASLVGTAAVGVVKLILFLYLITLSN